MKIKCCWKRLNLIVIVKFEYEGCDSRLKPFSYYKVNQEPINYEKIYTFINVGVKTMRLNWTQMGFLMDLNPILRINKHKDVT